MIGAIRVVSVERGHDPRRFALVAFGGAGPLHGCALAEMLGIRAVLIPPAPGILCADGLLAADLRSSFSRTVSGTAATVEATFAALELEAEAWLANEAIDPADRRTARVALMCYAGQGGELAVPWAGSVADTEAAFALAHERLYGFRLASAVRLVTLRVEARGLLPPPVHPTVKPGSGAQAFGETTVHFASGSAATPLFERDRLGAGDRVEGPAIVTQLDTTTLVPPGWAARADAGGSLVVERAG
jgi:N-methylhydantoinase A